VRTLAEALHLKDTEIAQLKHRLALFCRHQFGSRSERADPAQLALASLGMQGEPEAGPAEPPPAVPAEEPKRKGHGRRRLPPELPRERVEHTLPPEARVCAKCGGALHRIGRLWGYLGDDGGRRAAIFYSLIETCRRHGVEPFAYLRDILERVSTHPAKDIAALLPPNWKKAQETPPAAADRRTVGTRPAAQHLVSRSGCADLH